MRFLTRGGETALTARGESAPGPNFAPISPLESERDFGRKDFCHGLLGQGQLLKPKSLQIVTTAFPGGCGSAPRHFSSTLQRPDWLRIRHDCCRRSAAARAAGCRFRPGSGHSAPSLHEDRSRPWVRVAPYSWVRVAPYSRTSSSLAATMRSS